MLSSVLDKIYDTTILGYWFLWIVIGYSIYTLCLRHFINKEKLHGIYFQARDNYRIQLRIKKLENLSTWIAFVTTYLLWLGSHYC